MSVLKFMRGLTCLLVISTTIGNIINPDQNLCNALALSTGTTVIIQGNNFIIQGSPDALEVAYSYFQDPKAIRRDFLPPS